MNIRNNFLTNYFGFNKQQRNGLFMLICISFFLLLVRLSYPAFIKPEAIQVYDLPLIERRLDSTVHSRTSLSRKGDENSVVDPSLFMFDPNTVTAQQLIQLGFKEKTVSVFIKFRQKGFVFKEKKDLQKVYGVSDNLYAQLEPYILIEAKRISTEKQKVQETQKSESSASKSIQTLIELNSADSLSLMSLDGIGVSYAKRILKYRSILGGYVAVEQLKEVYGFSSELYEKVKHHFKVNSASVTKLHLNKDEFKVINKHPYISYELCKTIFDWRKKTKITETNLKDILNDPVLYQKLLPYLRFD